MVEHEEKLITAFILKEKQDRYRFLLGSGYAERRYECLLRLNHCRDLNETYVVWLPRNGDAISLLQQKGCPKLVHVLAGVGENDRKLMPLREAMNEITRSGWGAILSCIPGELAYYRDEEGARQAILERRRGT